MKKRAIVIFSGGMDSTTCIALAQQQGFEVYALSFNYGQRHNAELKAAAIIAQKLDVAEHKIIDLDLSALLTTSALTNSTIDVPKGIDHTIIPVTYVPARNTIMLSIALGWAEALCAYDIFIGISAIDYSNYPDCRAEYIDAFQKMADLATKAGVEGKPFTINTPLVNLSKAETIQAGLELGIDYRDTVSCYQLSDQGLACGSCPSCLLRKKGFEELGIADATNYV